VRRAASNIDTCTHERHSLAWAIQSRVGPGLDLDLDQLFHSAQPLRKTTRWLPHRGQQKDTSEKIDEPASGDPGAIEGGCRGTSEKGDSDDWSS
jgi:hypothetical protein